MMKHILFSFLLIASMVTYGQHSATQSADKWVDSIFRSLTEEQKIAQLMVIRMSTIEPGTRRVIFLDKEVEEAIQKYNVGGLCLFQGGPLAQADHLNYFQGFASTPLLICIDAENGVGMRMDSVMGLPRQMMLLNSCRVRYH